jgi:hypothetical protein
VLLSGETGCTISEAVTDAQKKRLGFMAGRCVLIAPPSSFSAKGAHPGNSASPALPRPSAKEGASHGI